MTHTKFIVFTIASLLLGACSQLPASAPETAPETASTTTPVATPATRTQTPARTLALAKPPAPAAVPAAPATGKQLQIDSAGSLIVVTVRRSGMLARLGHDHVVASHAITGTVSPSQNRADFTFRLDQMKIDEADLRQVAGLEKQPSADAIAGTRQNMLTKVLDAERYPLVSVQAKRSAAGQPLQVAITLHGVTRTLSVPVDLREENGTVAVKGAFTLKQSDFGIAPFSVMAGALSVQDQLELRFDLKAK
ncbi:YceI family protein [Duganella sp. BuS-21]|uniref:YceI family protein n=1 Tax=Duganella sp. BuS-21 TaxID=2943848 RepID=UPI0035A5F93F